MNKLPKIKSIRHKKLAISRTPEQVFAQFSSLPYAALVTGSGAKDNAHYSFIGINPFLIHQPKNNLFDEFQKMIDIYSVKKLSYPENLWGAVGYISYDAAHDIEKLPHTTTDDLHMPPLVMVFYKDMIVFDHQKNQQFLIQVQLENEEFSEVKISKKIPEFAFEVDRNMRYCSQKDYLEKIDKALKYIVDGDIYEVCLTHRFETTISGNPYGLFLNMYEKNPSPFSSYLNFDAYKIVSNSPERFLMADGKEVETRPIKGTVSRTEKKEVLLNSKKDDAELSMIVDLLRNDLGKVCEYGSVRVKEHKRIEGYQNVWQMLSIITGTLRKDQNYGDLLKACFPGGSITGCPKIRAMEIIDELEDYTRNLYTGSIFIANDQRLDSSICIRTAIIHDQKLYYGIGGAIVYESDPHREYDETLLKAKTFMIAQK